MNYHPESCPNDCPPCDRAGNSPAFRERMSSPCRACGVPLSYSGPVAATDLTLDYLRAILAEFKELKTALNAQNPARNCDDCRFKNNDALCCAKPRVSEAL